MSRFKGLPQFEWIEEIQIRLEDSFMMKSVATTLVGFESNPYLKGINFFTDIFNAIHNKQTLYLSYQGYRQTQASSFTISPWYLKQYNNRWFLFGFNDSIKKLSNLALDRIIEIQNGDSSYIDNSDIDFEEYFEDVVGVTVNESSPIETINMKISNEVWPYIASKPLHGSQRVKFKDEVSVTIELKVQINHELIATIFSYLDAIEIVEPMILRNRVKSIAQNLLNKNK